MRSALTRTHAAVLLTLAVVAAASCSPGTLPGTPSLLTVGGGGGRYNGTITTRRVGGNYTINEAAQALTLSLTLRGSDQISGRIDVNGNIGTLTGTLTGNLAGGSFQATMLVPTSAQQGATTTVCEGRGTVVGTLSGVNLSFTSTAVSYDNCPGLTTSSTAQAVAVSPIPDSVPNRANVLISILGGTRVPAGTCAGGVPGFPFTVEIAETMGIDVTLDDTFVAEERRGSGVVTSTTSDMPFTDLAGGSRRTIAVCSLVSGTYQAFVSGTDALGNRIHAASPVVIIGSATLPPAGGGGGTGTLSGTITNARTGQALSGATVTVGGLSATSGGNGVYTLTNAPAGAQTVQTSASGFTTRTDPVTIAAAGTTTFSTSLVPTGTGSNITIVLNWDAQPPDLDSYLTGPTTTGGRFTVSYVNRNPVPYASLDVDDTNGFGPETITVTTNGAAFVAGSYSYFVNNFSVTPGFNVSNASVSVFQSGAQLTRFAASAASGNPALANWSVFGFTLTATANGGISIAPVQQFTGTMPTILASPRRVKN
jgi:hypothetical protein